MTTTQAQPPRGFWVAAQAEPERIAVIDPAGREWTAGEIDADANRLVHALREPGLDRGRPRRHVAPQPRRDVRVAHGPVPGRLELRAAQQQPHRGRGGLHTARRRRARRWWPTPDSPTWRLQRPRSPACLRPAASRSAARSRAASLCSTRSWPGSPPRRRRTGSPASSCSTRRAQRVGPRRCERALPSFDPEVWVQVFSGNLTRYDIEPGGDAVHLVTSPMYHMAPLSFGYFSAHFEHTVVLMEKWDAEEALRLHRALPGHRRAHGAHAAAPAHAAAARGARSLRRVVAAPGHPRRRALPDGPQAAPVRVARPGDLRVLRRHRGRRHAGPARGLAGPPRHGRTALAGRRRQGARRRGQRGPARDGRYRLHEAHGRRLPLQGRCRQDGRRAATATSSPSATWASSTRTASCTCGTARST